MLLQFLKIQCRRFRKSCRWNAYGANGTAIVQYDRISQLEAGYKRKFSTGYINLTGFHSVTDEVLLNLNAGNKYKATGVEFEGAYIADFSVIGSVTYTNATIVEDRTSEYWVLTIKKTQEDKRTLFLTYLQLTYLI
jgi:outer membrane receptor protein involved in Fe transport